MRLPALSPIALLIAVLASAAPALAQPEPVTPESAPVFTRTHTRVIRHPGVYSLHGSQNVGDLAAIEIRASNVTLDLGGETISGLGGLQGVGIVIRDASNVRVHGGSLRNLAIGVQVIGSTNVTIEDLRIDGQDLGGAPPAVEIGVLLIDSKGVVVRNNVITETFLGIFVRGEESGGNRITGNTITGGANGELAICYNPADGAGGGGPDGDLVADNLISHFRRGMSFSADSTGNIVRGNSLAYFDLGIVEATAGSNVIEGNDEISIAP
jgi:parallel beta-helix repeat protein